MVEGLRVTCERTRRGWRWQVFYANGVPAAIGHTPWPTEADAIRAAQRALPWVLPWVPL